VTEDPRPGAQAEVVEASLPTLDPPVTTETEPFWAAAAEGRLVLPRCTSCGHHVWYPRGHCTACHGDVEWVEATGRGRIYTYTTVRRGMGPWREVAPYVLAVVELEEGPRVMSNVVGCDPDEVQIGQEVEVVFERAPSGGAVHRFRPVT
jgi:uncharacterized protein